MSRKGHHDSSFRPLYLLVFVFFFTQTHFTLSLSLTLFLALSLNIFARLCVQVALLAEAV